MFQLEHFWAVPDPRSYRQQREHDGDRGETRVESGTVGISAAGYAKKGSHQQTPKQRRGRSPVRRRISLTVTSAWLPLGRPNAARGGGGK